MTINNSHYTTLRELLKPAQFTYKITRTNITNRVWSSHK